MMEELLNICCSTIDAGASSFRDIGQEIWRNPELGLEEFHAHKILCNFFRERGFTVDEFLGPTGFRASYGSTDRGDGASSPSGVHVCLMAEYDALPELGHATAHNLVSEACVATAMGLKAAIDKKGTLGKVTVLGSPDSEGNGKKMEAIKDGFFKDVDLAVTFIPFTCHVAKPVMLTIMRETISFKGKAAHASTCPWDGRNALDAAILCYNNISLLRQQLKPYMQIHCIITNGGLKPNIIPEKTEMKFYLRAPDHIEMAHLQQRADAAFKAAARATGCELEIAFTPTPYSNLCNSPKLAALYQEEAEGLGCTFSTNEETSTRLVGSSDSGNVSHVVPTIAPAYDIAIAASATNTQSFAELAGTEEAHNQTMVASKAMCKALLKAMLDPAILAGIKSDFEKDSCAASLTEWS
ncbi:peptidase M20 domain-containing protein 2-like [Lytechinus variegatus]|uniref:peptidase M20 domain-containing protein 2-like n=1 Tax=Lytechinus variegatus TaxID=7654 RepID=UPI001BB1FA50|nr:peptidase M20 domain-containing protein 2-like [Lytechinus variegatus]